MKNAYFTPDFLDFFAEIKENNNREWFTENKERFVKNVKVPFDEFVQALIEYFQSKGEHLPVTFKECVYRIYRDIRFSKDKTPYKTRLSAVIAPKGRKEKPLIGLYFEINDEGFKLYSGIYSPDKQQLSAIRYAMAQHPDEFKKLINEKKFKKTYGQIEGEKNKRIPVEFREAAEIQPLIFNKSFYYRHDLAPDMLLTLDIIPAIWKVYKESKKITAFFMDAMDEME